MSSLNILQKGFGYVTFIYSDNSKLVFRTTLNTDLLLKEGVYINQTELYDFDRKKILKIPADVSIQITEEYPELSEVDKFANLYLWQKSIRIYKELYYESV